MTLATDWGGAPPTEWANRFGFATAEFHARIPSTNDRARALVRAGRPRPILVVASRQSDGKGRHGRRWASDSPLGLWFSVALPGDHDPAHPVPLRAGLAAALAVESLAPELAAGLKWPNDLVVRPEGRKFGGVLCERAAGATIVGVGLDLNHDPSDFPAELGDRATSVRAETGRRLSRADVLKAVLTRLDAIRAPAAAIPPDELEAINARSVLAGRSAVANGVARAPSGGQRAVEAVQVVCGSVLADGELEMRAAQGETLRLVAGSLVLDPPPARPRRADHVVPEARQVAPPRARRRRASRVAPEARQADPPPARPRRAGHVAPEARRMAPPAGPRRRAPASEDGPPPGPASAGAAP